MLDRRSLIKLAGLSAAGVVADRIRAQSTTATSLFDGKSLEGWIQIENSATSLSTAGIKDQPAFATWLINGSDNMSVYLRTRLPDSLKADLAAWSSSAANAQTVMSALVKALNQIISGSSLYDHDRIAGIVLRKETGELIAQNPRGAQIAHLNKLLLEDAYPEELAQSATTGWVVRDGAMASTGSGRGVIYTRRITAVSVFSSRCGMSRAIRIIRPAF